MIRLTFALCLTCALTAVEVADLPALAPAVAESGVTATPTTAPPTIPTQPATPARPSPKTADPAPPRPDTPDLPGRPAGGDLRLWTDRGVLLPRLAADLIARGVPETRPLAADYQLKANDVVRVVAWGGQPVNERIPVAPNGDLAIPGFGMVPVAGLSAGEAQLRVMELVRSHFKQGGVVVAIEQPAAQAVTVVGEVARPGYLTLPPGGTVLEALSAAGGVLPRGSLRAIRVAGAGQQVEIDLYRIAVDGDAAALTPLPAGALVFVPLSGPQVQMFGAVRRSAGIELKPGEALSEAVRLAGGLSADADPSRVRLLREGVRGQELSQVGIEALASLVAADADRLLITPRRDLAGAAGAVSVRGAVRSPGVYPLSEGLTLDRALAQAGGLLPSASKGVLIQRLLPEPQIVEQDGIPTPVSFTSLVAPPGDTILTALDEITVPLRSPTDPARSGVSISGAVGKPGLFAYTPGMTMRDLILLADRPLPAAQVDRVDLVRSHIDATGSRTVQTIAIDLRPVLAGTEAGSALQPGDVVMVRSTADARVKVELLGQFRNNGGFTIPAGTTVKQLIQMAGGLQPEAFPRGMRLFREQEKASAQEFLRDLTTRLETSLAINQRGRVDAPGDEERADVERTIARQQADLTRVRQAVATGRMGGINLERILAGDEKADLVLQDGDRIELPARPGSIRILGEVMVPGSLLFQEDLSVKEVVARSGGMTRQADEDSVFVVRADGSVVATAQGDTLAWDHDRRKWARTSLRGLKLMEGDAVIVPADVRYTDTTRRVVRDWTQIMFQVAATVGTIAVLAK